MGIIFSCTQGDHVFFFSEKKKKKMKLQNPIREKKGHPCRHTGRDFLISKQKKEKRTPARQGGDLRGTFKTKGTALQTGKTRG